MTSPHPLRRMRIARSTRLMALNDRLTRTALGAFAAVLLEGRDAAAQVAQPASPPPSSAAPSGLNGTLELGVFSQPVTLDRWRGAIVDPARRSPTLYFFRGELSGTIPTFGLYVRTGAYVRPWLYVLLSLHYSAILGLDVSARPGIPPVFGASQGGLGATVGVQWRPFSRVALRGEFDVALSLRTLEFCMDLDYGGRSEVMDIRLRLEPRAAIEVSVSSTSAVGLSFGTDILLPSEWSGALFMRWWGSSGDTAATPPRESHDARGRRLGP